MKYVKKKLSELKPYENNPRINDEAVDDVAESIKQCSYIAPIIIDEDGVIIKALGGVKPKENAAQMSSLRRAVWSSVLRRWIRTGSRRELPAMPYGIG